MKPNTELNLHDVLFYTDLLNCFNCVKLIINDEVVWDDGVGIADFIRLEDAWEKYKNNNIDWEKYMVTDVNIKIVQFHHSIVSVNCEKQDDEYNFEVGM